MRYAQHKEVPLKRILTPTVAALALVFAVACGASRYDAPADHTESQEGAMHKPGLKQPKTNCSACHGADLNGGKNGVSCFECHKQKW